MPRSLARKPNTWVKMTDCSIGQNTEMNYWPASLCNLQECEDPLFDLLERVAARGEHTASAMYGCRGWAAHHNTDIFADTDPQDRWMPATGEGNPFCLSFSC